MPNDRHSSLVYDHICNQVKSCIERFVPDAQVKSAAASPSDLYPYTAQFVYSLLMRRYASSKFPDQSHQELDINILAQVLDDSDNFKILCWVPSFGIVFPDYIGQSIEYRVGEGWGGGVVKFSAIDDKHVFEFLNVAAFCRFLQKIPELFDLSILALLHQVRFQIVSPLLYDAKKKRNQVQPALFSTPYIKQRLNLLLDPGMKYLGVE